VTKSRFTKYFSFLSTVFVDNFVENAPIRPLLPWDKVYFAPSPARQRKNKPFEISHLDRRSGRMDFHCLLFPQQKKLCISRSALVRAGMKKGRAPEETRPLS
jgi:hypothetical protein